MNITQSLEQHGHQRGLKRGLQQSLQQGLEQGGQQIVERIARATLVSGLDLLLVAKPTGFALECLARLQH